ncbi:hypothetical protein [Variovorax boronicumulans]
MARIEWVKTRLDNWARWRCQMAGNGLGFASQAAFLNDPSGSERTVKIPTDEIEASITHEGVESLKASRPHVYQVLYCMYPFGLGVSGTCRRLECERANVYALLDVADRLLSAWFTERAAKQEAARAAIKRSSAT